MVTKFSQYQQRRTPTAGKVPVSADLLVGEIVLNTTDRKAYSKDPAGNVWEVGGRKGKAIGDVVSYESYDGIRSIKTTGDATVFARSDVAYHNAIDWYFLRVQNNGGPDTTFGFTNSNVKMQTVVNVTSDASEWVLNTVLDVNAPSTQAQHVNQYNQAHKNADAKVWTMATELGDIVSNPTTGSIGFELGMFVKGKDPNNQRIGLHFACGPSVGADPGAENEIGHGIIMGGPAGLYIKKGISFQGSSRVALDLSGLNLGYSASAIGMLSSTSIEWHSGLINAASNATVASTKQASFGWAAAASTFALTGMRLSSQGGYTVGAAVNHAIIYINGAPFAIDLKSATPV